MRQTTSHTKNSEPAIQMKGLKDLLVRVDNRFAPSLSINSSRPNFRPVYICRRALARVDPKVRHTTSQHWGLKVGDYIHEIRKNKNSLNLSPYCRISKYCKTPLSDPEWQIQRANWMYEDVYMGETSLTDAEIEQMGRSTSILYTTRIDWIRNALRKGLFDSLPQLSPFCLQPVQLYLRQTGPAESV